MVRNPLPLCYMLLALLLVAWPCACRAAEGPISAEPPTLVSLEIEAGNATTIPLAHNCVVLLQPDGKSVQVPIVLHEVPCKIKAKRLFRGQVAEQAGSVSVYELHSTDPRTPYTWAYVNNWPIVGFELSSSGGENYFGFVEGMAVFFGEVSRPKDRFTAVAEFCAGGRPPLVRLPLKGLVPYADTGVDAFNAQVRVTSISRDKENRWVVAISSLVSGEVYAIVGDGRSWHTVSSAPPTPSTSAPH